MSAALYRRALRLARGNDPELYSWLADGWAALEDGNNLAVALGFRGPQAKPARNRLLRAAAEALAPGKRPWAQAEALRDAIEQADYSQCDTATAQLIQDVQLYGCVPRTERQLYKLLTD